jgi:basic membrane protein A
MRVRFTFSVAVVAAAVAALAFALVANASSSRSSAHAASTPFKVGLVTDTGGLNDHGFNHLAYVGLLQAEHQLGVKGTVLQSSTQADYIPNLQTLAAAGNNLIITNGFLMQGATIQIAKQYPHIHFAMIDVDAVGSGTGKNANPQAPKNDEGLLFREQQPGYLVGYLAGLYSKAHGYKTIGDVGGDNIGPVTRYIAGYYAGAAKADPGIKILTQFSNDFNDQSKCEEIALHQIQQGSHVEFQVAGGCGIGVITAAKAQGVQAIGVDADQNYIAPSVVLTSALKRVNKAVFDAIKNLKAGKFTGGKDTYNDITNGGIGYGKIDAAGRPFASKLAAVLAKMKAGKLNNIPSTIP